jgi:hypothetical protein
VGLALHKDRWLPGPKVKLPVLLFYTNADGDSIVAAQKDTFSAKVLLGH